jgi:hypothetical protein
MDLLRIAKESGDKGRVDVSILSLMDLEEQISKLIDNLSERGLYPETEENGEARKARQQQHTLKVIQFLKALKAAREQKQNTQ